MTKVGITNLGLKLDLGRSRGVVGGQINWKPKNALFIARMGRPNHQPFPPENVAADRPKAAVRRRFLVHRLQLVLNPIHRASFLLVSTSAADRNTTRRRLLHPAVSSVAGRSLRLSISSCRDRNRTRRRNRRRSVVSVVDRERRRRRRRAKAAIGGGGGGFRGEATAETGENHGWRGRFDGEWENDWEDWNRRRIERLLWLEVGNFGQRGPTVTIKSDPNRTLIILLASQAKA